MKMKRAGGGYQNRKKYLRDVKRDLRGYRIKKRSWPELQEGEYVYFVKHINSGESKEVIASDRSEAEYKAFPHVLPFHLRSIPIHSWTGKKSIADWEKGERDGPKGT